MAVMKVETSSHHIAVINLANRNARWHKKSHGPNDTSRNSLFTFAVMLCNLRYSATSCIMDVG
jgi:hypothetical protein